MIVQQCNSRQVWTLRLAQAIPTASGSCVRVLTVSPTSSHLSSLFHPHLVHPPPRTSSPSQPSVHLIFPPPRLAVPPTFAHLVHLLPCASSLSHPPSCVTWPSRPTRLRSRGHHRVRWRYRECRERAQRPWATTTTNIDCYVHIAVKAEDYCSRCRLNSIFGLPMYLLS